MDTKLNYLPFTYLMKNQATGQYELYIYIPVAEGQGIKFPNIPTDAPTDDNVHIQNMIRFIDCEVTDSAEDGVPFKRYTLSRTFFHQEETIEVRVRFPDKENKYIWFNRTIVFFDDADEQDPHNLPNGWKKNQQLAVNAPYLFIGKPEDFFDHERLQDPDIILHLLFPRPGQEPHLTTLKTKKGPNAWDFNTKIDPPELVPVETPNEGLSPRLLPSSRRLKVNIREGSGRVDKPETPPLGSVGNNTNIFIRE